MESWWNMFWWKKMDEENISEYKKKFGVMEREV
jgi:hypothetical protein